MEAIGIVAEYNPFHAGHAAQLAQLRALRPDAAIVIALSGDFVQRGEAAVFSKFARAEAAVRCGASLVLELPLPWSLASAEGFARGGVGLLLHTGAVDALSFGSESGDLAAIRSCARALESPEFPAALREELSSGAPFALARRRAAARLAGEATVGVLDKPNDLLAVEYVRAADRLGGEAEFLPILRRDSTHDGENSASELRQRMARGEAWISGVPEAAAAVFLAEQAARRGPVLAEDLRLPLLSRLRERTREDFAAAPDVSEGLENLLYDAAQELADPAEIAAAAKSKRYALSRLRRAVLCTALGVKAGDALGTPPYLRVLAMDGRGAVLLARMRETARVPVITKSAHVRRAGEEIQRLFDLGSQAHDLYVLGYGDRWEQRGGGDYRAVPYLQLDRV